jgi:hypothetical protein
MIMKSFVCAIALASAVAAPAFAQDAGDMTEPTAEEQAAYDADKEAAVATDEGTGLSADEEAALDAEKATAGNAADEGGDKPE